MSDTSTDRVAAYLAEVAKRYSTAAASPQTSRQVVAASADDVPALLDALEAVLAIHKPTYFRETPYCAECCRPGGLTGCAKVRWPCPTYTAISAALLGESRPRLRESSGE